MWLVGFCENVGLSNRVSEKSFKGTLPNTVIGILLRVPFVICPEVSWSDFAFLKQ